MHLRAARISRAQTAAARFTPRKSRCDVSPSLVPEFLPASHGRPLPGQQVNTRTEDVRRANPGVGTVALGSRQTGWLARRRECRRRRYHAEDPPARPGAGRRTAGHSQALVKASPGDVHEGARQRRTDLRGGGPGGPGRVRRVQAEVRETRRPLDTQTVRGFRGISAYVAGRGASLTTKVPSMYEMERTSPGPGPTWPANRPSGTETARRGRASARTAGFPAPPASRSHLRMMPVSNGKSILTVPAGRPQGSAGIHFWFFRRPHFVHRRRLVIRIIRCLSTGLCTARPQVPWITSEIAVGSIFSRARRHRDGRRRCTAAAPARICR